MIALRFFRWVRGWITFSLLGARAEEFLMATKGYVWNFREKDGVYYGCCFAKHYKSIAKEAKKTHCRIHNEEKGGLPFWIHRYRFRFGILVGGALVLILLFFSTFFVWSVQVDGNIMLTTDAVLSAAADAGLKEGALRNSFDVQEVEYALKQTFPEIAWISINRSGTRYNIEISEATPKPHLEENEQPCNVVSDYDAVIRSVEPYRGVSQIKPGDVVQKGQLLVSGIKEYEGSEVVYYTHANAKVIGEVTQTFDYSLPLTTAIPKKTGETVTKKKLCVLGLEIPLYLGGVPKGKAEVSVEKKPVTIFGFTLPMEIETFTYQMIEDQEISGEIDKLERALTQQAKEDESNQFKDAKILKRKYDFEQTDNSLILHATYTVQRQIGREEPIAFANPQNPQEENAFATEKTPS